MDWPIVVAVAVAVSSLSSALFAGLSWYQAYRAHKIADEHDRWERWMLESSDRRKTPR